MKQYADLFVQDRSAPHWAYDYAARLAGRHPRGHRILIQTSMSPTGPFHIGNLRDTICAHLVHRALVRSGRRCAILLSFDDFDPFRPRQAAADPALAPYGARPLAVARERSTAICRAYLRELKDLGICPPEADADGRTPAGSAWLTHYQWERYTGGEYRHIQRAYIRRAGRLAGILGVTDPRKLFAVYCQQCGRNTTVLHELHPRSARYDCRSCGAYVTTSRMECVKPAWAVDWTLRVTHEHIDCEPAGQDHCSAGSTMDRTRAVYRRFLGTRQPVIVPYGLVRQSGQRHKISGSRAGGLLPRDLLRVLPPRLILWLYARPNCRSDMRVGLDHAALLAAWDGWDRFVATLPASPRARALWALLTDDPPPQGPPPPPMRTILGRLHSAAYDAQAVTDAPAGSPSVAERVRYALAWLAGPGRDTSWLLRAGAGTGPAGDDPLRDGGLGGPWDRARHAALLRALFAVPDGPPLRRLLAQHGEETIVAAVREHERTGRRPLRDQALARLDKAGAGRAR